MSINVTAPLLVGVALMMPVAALAQEQQSKPADLDKTVPPVKVLQDKPKAHAKPTKKRDAGTKKSQEGVSGGEQGDTAGSGSGTAGAGNGSGRADLAADSVTNPYRVAPSSRQHTQTYSRQDIENLHPTDVFDLLGHATGVLSTYQGRKMPNNLFIRGDSNFGFIVDGAYIPSFIAARILQSLPLSSIEQVDIVRDASALTLGPLVDFSSASGALNSGFIVIRTRRPAKSEAEASVGGGSYGTFNSNTYAGTTFNRDGWTGYTAMFGSYKTTDGPEGYNMWGNSLTGIGKVGAGYGGFFTEAMIYGDHTSYGFERAIASQTTANLANQKWSYDPVDTLLVTSNSRMSWDGVNTTLLTVSANQVQQANVLNYYNTSLPNSTPAINNERDDTETVNLRHRVQINGTMLEAGG